MLITKLFAYAKVFLVFVDVLVFLGDCNLSQIDTHCLFTFSEKGTITRSLTECS